MTNMVYYEFLHIIHVVKTDFSGLENFLREKEAGFARHPDEIFGGKD